MKIRFNGMFAKKLQGGCGCGGHVKSGRIFVTHKTFVLPSGQTRAFSINEEYVVTDIDGYFLLSYSQTDKDGLVQSAFTRLD